MFTKLEFLPDDTNKYTEAEKKSLHKGNINIMGNIHPP